MKFIHQHLEWLVFSAGLLVLAFMDPEYAGTSFCLFDLAGIDFCPGEGLGHSISYTFKGEIDSAMNAHFAGPIAILILSSRITYLWHRLYKQSKLTLGIKNHGECN
ncbi:DUF2752 domain-containing protein [Gracilimonas halophila]|uniref:DUF2752 domain-containing protein n=1 Tax=Gracilimonas halophila TaxID=1834464 RepID=A0ABW5JHS1_9BACT